MKAQALHLRIGRVVLDAPLASGTSAEALARALEAELSAAETTPAGDRVAAGLSTDALARAIAGGIAGRLDAGPRAGGRHG